MNDELYLYEVKKSIPIIKDLIYPRFKHYYYPELVQALRNGETNKVKFCINRMWYFLGHAEFDKDVLPKTAHTPIYTLWILKELDTTQYTQPFFTRYKLKVVS